MLNRKICKRCYNKYSPMLWGTSMYNAWKRNNLVYCPMERDKTNGEHWAWISTKENPPTECPFALEHQLEMQDAQNQDEP